MTKEDFELFKIIAQSSQPKLKKMLYKILKRHYKNIENTQDYIIAQGDIPIAVAAHMDTVFKLPPEDIYYDKEEGVMWSPDGLGADDRAGVFLILKIIQSVSKNKKPSIIFTTDEECGCAGAAELALQVPKAPYDLKYIIQLDRRGQFDCVFYDDANDKFQDYVESFGFKTNWGTFSDISVICPTWGISGVNLSVGYEDEHQEIETLHTQYMYLTLHKVLMMLDDVNNAPYFTYEAGANSFKWWNYGHNYYSHCYNWYDDDDDDYPKWGYNTVYCDKCKKEIDKHFAIKAIDEYNVYHYYCGDCARDEITWCTNCGKAFVNHNHYNQLCPDCIELTWTKEPVNDTKV